jgi:hypothetical protein
MKHAEPITRLRAKCLNPSRTAFDSERLSNEALTRGITGQEI